MGMIPFSGVVTMNIRVKCMVLQVFLAPVSVIGFLKRV